MIDLDRRDPGDYDPTEVDQAVPNAWHPSHLPATPTPPSTTAPTPTGTEYLASLRAMCTQRKATDRPAKAQFARPAWREAPEAFRRLVARAAGLPADVCDKLDRDLSESEKVLIRAAAKRLTERASALLAL